MPTTTSPSTATPPTDSNSAEMSTQTATPQQLASPEKTKLSKYISARLGFISILGGLMFLAITAVIVTSGNPHMQLATFVVAMLVETCLSLLLLEQSSYLIDAINKSRNLERQRRLEEQGTVLQLHGTNRTIGHESILEDAEQELSVGTSVSVGLFVTALFLLLTAPTGLARFLGGFMSMINLSLLVFWVFFTLDLAFLDLGVQLMALMERGVRRKIEGRSARTEPSVRRSGDDGLGYEPLSTVNEDGQGDEGENLSVDFKATPTTGSESSIGQGTAA